VALEKDGTNEGHRRGGGTDDYGRIHVQGTPKRLEDQTDTKTKQRKTPGGVDKGSDTSMRSVGR
jgi:hypothetical protein